MRLNLLPAWKILFQALKNKEERNEAFIFNFEIAALIIK
jgi:hypothetical protein